MPTLAIDCPVETFDPCFDQSTEIDFGQGNTIYNYAGPHPGGGQRLLSHRISGIAFKKGMLYDSVAYVLTEQGSVGGDANSQWAAVFTMNPDTGALLNGGNPIWTFYENPVSITTPGDMEGLEFDNTGRLYILSERQKYFAVLDNVTATSANEVKGPNVGNTPIAIGQPRTGGCGPPEDTGFGVVGEIPGYLVFGPADMAFDETTGTWYSVTTFNGTVYSFDMMFMDAQVSNLSALGNPAFDGVDAPSECDVLQEINTCVVGENKTCNSPGGALVDPNYFNTGIDIYQGVLYVTNGCTNKLYAIDPVAQKLLKAWDITTPGISSATSIRFWKNPATGPDRLYITTGGDDPSATGGMVLYFEVPGCLRNPISNCP